MSASNRTGSWAQIELYNGYRGWVNASYIRPTIDLAALPIVDVALWGITAFVTNDPIPVYVGPDRGYQLVGRAQPGEVLALSGRNDAVTWVYVYLPDGRAGWVAANSSFLPSASLNDLPIITPSSTQRRQTWPPSSTSTPAPASSTSRWKVSRRGRP